MIKLYSSEFYKPKISIGLPVFNGEKYLSETLDSILEQNFDDYELIISDNASTDKTREICQYYAASDDRISYYRNRKNIGGFNNFNQVFKLSCGEYFKWFAHDDLISSNFIKKCVEVLNKDQSIVLCHSKTIVIDENGNQIRTSSVRDRINVDSEKPHIRFNSLLWDRKFPSLIFGVIRSDVLKNTPLLKNYIGSDRNLLAEIGLRGRIFEIPEYLFYRRSHPESFSRKDYRDLRKRLAWIYPEIKDKISLEYWKRFIEYFQIVRRVPLEKRDQLLCYTQILNWLIRKGWILMGYELVESINESLKY